MDGMVECGQCGMQQRFDVAAWHQALGFAHEVGDLAYPPPEGRHPHEHIWIGSDNPHIRIGYTEAFGEHRQSNTFSENNITVHRSLFIQASPGHPVCRACAEPLSVIVSKKGGVATRCGECDSTAKHTLPAQAKKWCPSLVGVVCDEHRSDQKRAKMETTVGGIIALRCPECSSALPASRERVITCDYCGASAFIPSQARIRDAGQAIQPEIWWLAFRGASHRRRALEWRSYDAEQESQPAEGTATKLLSKFKGDDSALELAPRAEKIHLAQWALRIGLPVLALGIGYIVTVLLKLALPV